MSGAALLVALAGLWGCPGSGSRGGAADGSGAGKSSSKRGPEGDKVVARIGSETITVAQLEDELNKLHPSVRVRFSSPERRKDFLKNLVRFEVLAREARRRGLDKDPEVIKRVKRAMIDVMMDKIRASLVKLEDVTDKDVEQYYNEHLKQFRREPQARASIIVAKTRPEAAALLAKVKAKAGDVKFFAGLAAQKSIDPATKVKRGDLGFFSKDSDKVSEAVRKAVFGLDGLWSYGGPIKVEQGYAIVMKTGETPGFSRPLQMERNRIRNRIFNQRRLEAVDKFVTDLQQKADIKINPKNLALVKPKDAPHPPASMQPTGGRAR